MRACTIFDAEEMSLHSALCMRDALPNGLTDDARIASMNSLQVVKIVLNLCAA